MYRIKEVAKEKGLTISRLAEIVETTQPNLSAIINEKAKPSIDMLQRISEALGVHITALFEQPKQNTFTCPKCGTCLEIREKSDYDINNNPLLG